MMASSSQMGASSSSGIPQFSGSAIPGTQFVFAAYDDMGLGAYFAMDAAGGNLALLTGRDAYFQGAPQLNAARDRLAVPYQFDMGTHGGWTIFSLDGTEQVSHPIAGYFDDGRVAFSPDGSRVAFATGGGGSNTSGRAMAMAADGTGVETNLIPPGTHYGAGAVSFSHGGTRVALWTMTFNGGNPPYDTRIRVVDASTGTQISASGIIVRNDSPYRLVWSPLDDLLYYVVENKVHRYTVATGADEVLYDHGLYDNITQHQFIRTLDLSADGSLLALSVEDYDFSTLAYNHGFIASLSTSTGMYTAHSEVVHDDVTQGVDFAPAGLQVVFVCGAMNTRVCVVNLADAPPAPVTQLEPPPGFLYPSDIPTW